MRTPKALSPSALTLWLENKEQYYLKYLADRKPPNFLQNEPMSVGSAFDAYVKAQLASDLGITTPTLEFEHLFENQVESHNRDWAREAGLNCFQQYFDSGSYQSLLTDLEKSETTPQLEFGDGDRREIIKEIDDVPLRGIPDLLYSRSGYRIVFDWKVNGYCSKSGVYPAKGYKRVRAGWNPVYGKYPNNHGQSHRDYDPWMVGDIEIHNEHYLEEVKPDWARQITTYGLLAGVSKDEPFIAAIDQLACRPSKTKNGFVLIQTAEHRCEITPDFSKATFTQYKDLWETIKSEYIFRDLDEADSRKRQELLDGQAVAFEGDTVNDQWFREMTGRG